MSIKLVDTLEPMADFPIAMAENIDFADGKSLQEKYDSGKLVSSAEAPVKVTDGKISLDTVPITKGGTGVTTQEDINKAFINNLEIDNSDVTDGTEFVSSWASDNGFAETAEGALNKPYKRQFIKVWNYIKNKISSVLGLTSAKVLSYDSHLTNKDNPHSVTKSQVGLGSVVNTGDSATPVSGGTTKFTTGGAYTELNKKVDKVDGKGLSSNDFTNTYKDKLDNTDTTVTTDSSNLVTSGAVATAISTEVTNRNTAITNAINNLDVSSVGGDGEYISAISETDGKISATSTTMDTAPTTNSVKAVTSGGIKTAISTAETNAKNLANATGTLPVANGGTGVTTQADINKAFVGGLGVGNDDVTDGTEFVSSYASDNGFADSNALNKPYKRKFSAVWNYIKDKISSVLGLTKDNYGGKAATAGTANNAKNMYSQTLDLSALDKTKFYPAFCASGTNFAEVSIHSPGLTGNAKYNQNRIHFDISTLGWTDTPFTLNIREYACYDNNEVTIGCIGRGLQDGGWAIWLRGGLTYNCFTRNCNLNLKTSDYAYGNERYTVGTNYYGGTNSNVQIVFTPQSTITNGAYSSRPITAPTIKATTNFIGNLTGNVTGNVTGSSGSCTGNSATATTADKATNDGNGNNIVNTYALKSNLQYTKSININKVNGSSDTWYYLIAKTLGSNAAGNIDSLFVNGSDYRERMFEGSICTRDGNFVYNYGKDNLPIELYEQTDGAIYVYWLVSDAYNKVALNITATMAITIYGGNLSPVTPTGSKMTLTEYDYKSYETLPVARGGTGQTTAKAAANLFINSLELASSVPKDDDYFISQYVDGGTTNTAYYRRPISKLWEYIKGKISSVLGLTENTIATLRTNADAGFLCKLYQLTRAIQTYNVILLGKIPDPASTAEPDTPSVSWDIDVDFYFIRPTGHKAAWCNVKAGYGYSNAWRKYGLIETFGVDASSNYTNPFYLVTVKYNNEYYIGVRHTCNIDGKYSARVKNVNTNGNGNPSTADGSSLVNMLKVIPYQKTTDGTILNNEIKTSIVDFPNTYAPAVERNGDLVLKSGYVKIGANDVAGSKLTIQGKTVASNSYTDTNPKLEFKNNDGSQNISLTFNDYDSVQAPASLTLNGNQGNEYFIAPNIKATTKFIGNLTGNVTGNVTGSSGSANKLTTARTAYVDLGTASTTRTIDWSGDTTIPVNGVLGVANGGTGATTAESAANTLIANLPASDGVPVDTDYFISQVVNGGPFVPGYERRPISKLWEYIKGKILQEGEDFGYNHIVYDDASLLEWANCTDGSMKKVLVKSGTYNMTKGVDFSKAGTGYVFAENGAVINSKVPIAFSAPSGKTTIHNLKVVCGPSSDNTCAFSASDIENLILYDCEAGYATNTVTVGRNLFSKCTCYNCHYDFTNSSSNSSISLKVFYQCYCYNCICKQTIAANSSTGIVFGDNSYFYKECVCVSCDAELTILRNIKAANPTFSCYYNCWDRCVGCLSEINVNSKALTVYSTLYGFLRCQHMSSCKEVHTVGYSNIKGVVQCIYISSTSAVSGESNTSVGNSCDI